MGSASDRGHRPGGLEECRVVDAVTRTLAQHRHPPGVGDLLIRSTAAEQCAQIGLLGGEETVAYLAVRRQSGTVAVPTERPGHTADDADPRRPSIDPDIAGNKPGLRRRRST